MMRRILPLIIIAFIGSAVLGWLKAGTSAGAQPPIADGWEAMQYNPPSKADYARTAKRVQSSSLLPLSRIVENRRAAAGEPAAAQTSAAQPFPAVAGHKRVGRTDYMMFFDADNVRLTVKAGDVLESGWEIQSISRTEVVATFDGEELKTPIVPYLQSAFEKPNDAVINDAVIDDNGETKMPSQNGGGE